jgi:predicted amidohydrolase
MFRIALANAPFPKSIEDGMRTVESFAALAAGRGAQVLAFPESYIPGYRGLGEPVENHNPTVLEAALEQGRNIARQYRIALILSMDLESSHGIQKCAVVLSGSGKNLGHQTKNQLDPTEDEGFVPGTHRGIYEINGVRVGVVICHEGFRYPESVRWAARRGAQIVFHPHCTGSNLSGPVLTEFRHPENPYYEQAMMCRALENTIYVAGVNYAFRFQESASCVFGPQGETIAYHPYRDAGVLFADLDLRTATGHLARRYRPELY